MKKEIKTILIATGIYPPQIGGPAEYAKNLEEVWQKEGRKVLIATFNFEKKLPTGIRHLYFLIKNFSKFIQADFIFVLDTWSVAMPTAIACLILRKSFVIRTGGDFLWESYVERTKKKVLFRNFYKTESIFFNLKERIIFKTTVWVLKRASKVIFSTTWQRDIWQIPYNLDLSKTKIIENFSGGLSSGAATELKELEKIFVASTRDLVWKNKDMLQKAFSEVKREKKEIELFNNVLPHNEFIQKIRDSYAVILVSLGDISPNMILDALYCGKPFICTKECGLYEKLKNIGLWIDPLNSEDIKQKILYLSDEKNYSLEQEKIRSFKFDHSWQEIAQEILI